MVRLSLLSLLFLGLFPACQESGYDDCYALNVSESECLARGRCRFKKATLLLLGPDGCLKEDVAARYGALDTGIGACLCEAPPEKPTQHIDNGPAGATEFWICRRESPSLVLRIPLLTGLDSTHGVPPDWEVCASNYDGSPLLPNDYFSGYCMPTCGNDLVEPGEQCDGRTLNAGHPCGALAHWTEQSLGDGLVWCTDCRWDFATCTP
ncbi:hypothetical protein KKC22_13200 [Myxococcota bacterium]|nr:hypothetical protein [Myxococcota bacterium]